MTPTKYSKLLLGILFPQQIVPMQCPITMVVVRLGVASFQGEPLRMLSVPGGVLREADVEITLEGQ